MIGCRLFCLSDIRPAAMASLLSIFECVARARLSVSVLVSISTHPCKLVGLLPSMYVYIGLSFLLCAGEWYFVK